MSDVYVRMALDYLGRAEALADQQTFERPSADPQFLIAVAQVYATLSLRGADHAEVEP